MKLSVILPAYNAEKTLFSTLFEVYGYLRVQPYDFEIIVVNDGSNDRTLDIADHFSAEIQPLHVLSFEQNEGKGAAVCRGLLAGKGDFRLFMDADNSTTIDHLDRVWPHFTNGCDVVIGTRSFRDVPGALQARPQPFWRRIFGIFGNWIIQASLIHGIWDTQCGFKILSGRAVDDIVPKISTKGWSFDVELLLLARASGYKIALIPVSWINSRDSRFKLHHYVSSFLEIIQIKAKKR